MDHRKWRLNYQFYHYFFFTYLHNEYLYQISSKVNQSLVLELMWNKQIKEFYTNLQKKKKNLYVTQKDSNLSPPDYEFTSELLVLGLLTSLFFHRYLTSNLYYLSITLLNVYQIEESNRGYRKLVFLLFCSYWIVSMFLELLFIVKACERPVKAVCFGLSGRECHFA